jgi:glycosyltransferase involved in cell wall biosynthesis
VSACLALSVAIPTYRRESVLLDTLEYLLHLNPRAAEILVIDQTEQHEHATETYLKESALAGRIRWLRLDRPSITHAMNCALVEASQEIVLFIDDDIRPDSGLLTAHFAAHQMYPDTLIAGRVIQPWQENQNFTIAHDFHFATLKPMWIEEFMGGNFSVDRHVALRLGGFDENFVRVAYRFEAEFAHRYVFSGRRIFFEPGACLHHLKTGKGGTRSFGDHLTTFKPDHAVGAYYYFLRTWMGWRSVKSFVARPLRAVATRHHLRHPWWIVATSISEFLGMCWAIVLFLRGPRYVTLGAKESVDA